MTRDVGARIPINDLPYILPEKGMNFNMKKSIIRIGCFIIILGIVLLYVNRVFKFKYGDGIYGVTKFYELEDDTVDVLILGSSHAFEDFNTGVLWNEYGIASYILAGSVQPMWNTYYYLKEALKTQTPELIVLEGFCVNRDQEFIDDSRIIKNTYGLKWSLDKLNAIKISSPKERWMEFIPEYTQYHTRYTELSKADFYSNQGNPLYEDWKGFGCAMATTSLEAIDVSGVENRNPLFEKSEEYYRKTIELAQENNIPIVVVISPYAGINENTSSLYNTASDIAAEYGVDFINCNLFLGEIGINYATDAADTNHLNYKGNQKFSHYIGRLLKDSYAISDRREDPKYVSWQRNADYISQMIYNQELREMTDIHVISEKILNKDYRLIISVDGNCNTADESLQFFYSAVEIMNDGTNGIWYRDNINGIMWSSSYETTEKYITDSTHDFGMKRTIDEEGIYSNQIIVDNKEYKKVENGINIVVYDTITETVADSFGVNLDDGYNIVR